MGGRLLIVGLLTGCAAPRADWTARVACDGAPSDCFIAGLAHEFGVEAAPDTSSAVSLYEQACTDGDAIACGYLASNLMRPGLSPDLNALGNRLYRRSCNLGLGYACVALGVKVARGFGAAADPERALEHLDAACALDTGDGCRLADALRSGRTEDLERFSLPFASREQVNAALSMWPVVVATCNDVIAHPVVLQASWVMLHATPALVEVRSHPQDRPVPKCVNEAARSLPLPPTCVYCAYHAVGAAVLGGPNPPSETTLTREL